MICIYDDKDYLQYALFNLRHSPLLLLCKAFKGHLFVNMKEESRMSVDECGLVIIE